MGLYDKLEKFHDTNRYFIPLMFVALVLMASGWNFIGPVSLDYSVNITKPLSFSRPVVVEALMLRPGWTFEAKINASKPVTVVLSRLNDGEVTSGVNTITYKPDNLDFYFVKVVEYRNYTINGISYSKKGTAPYPDSYLLFGSGLLLALGVLIYYLLEPWGFKLKRKMPLINSLFYPATFFLASVIFLLFKELFVWFLPHYLLLFSCAAVIIISVLLMPSLKKGNFSRVFLGFLNAYALLLLKSYIDFAYNNPYLTLVAGILSASLLFYLFLRYREKTGVTFYLVAWSADVLIRFLAFAIKVPVLFDTLLSVPSMAGALALLTSLEVLAIISAYFVVRAYYSRNINEASSFGLYAGAVVQAILQVLVVSLW